jgi:hypothetical protein
VRRALVESRANLVTSCRGLAREQGVVLPKCTVPNLPGRRANRRASHSPCSSRF